MNYTTELRKDNLRKFVEFVEDAAGEDDDRRIIDFFRTKRLAEGVEGEVFKATRKDDKSFPVIVIKTVDLIAIKYSKMINRFTLAATPDALYELFESKKVFNNNALIEIIGCTLVNQLILQKICPNYSLNYYWDVEDTRTDMYQDKRVKHLNTYSEYVDGGVFEDWAERHDEPELWFNALFQIMAGLSAMKRYYDMLHTDFHTKNILIKKVKPGGYWRYTIDEREYYLPNLGYVFLIHDFGFAWIPRKMKVDWYYKKYLRFVNKNGLHFYDMEGFLDTALNDEEFLTPKAFKRIVGSVFKKEETEYIYSKSYYHQDYVQDDMSRSEYKRIMREYPDIDKNYKGLGTTIADKIYELFYKSHGKDNLYFNYGDRAYHTRKGNLIESYSLDKDLDKSKLPENFRKLVT
jgi:hypothetical protein